MNISLSAQIKLAPVIISDAKTRCAHNNELLVLSLAGAHVTFDQRQPLPPVPIVIDRNIEDIERQIPYVLVDPKRTVCRVCYNRSSGHNLM